MVLPNVADSVVRNAVPGRSGAAAAPTGVVPQQLLSAQLTGGPAGGLTARLGELRAITQCVCPCCIQVAGRLFCCD